MREHLYGYWKQNLDEKNETNLLETLQSFQYVQKSKPGSQDREPHVANSLLQPCQPGPLW